MKPTHTYTMDGALMRRVPKCRRCGARIVFADHPTTGSRVPLDFATRLPADEPGRWRLQIHFAVCGRQATVAAPTRTQPVRRRAATAAALERAEAYQRGEC